MYLIVQFFCKKNDALKHLCFKVQFFCKKNDALKHLYKYKK